MSKILAVDFDLTLTDFHSGGLPAIGKSLWDGNNLELLEKLLAEFKEKGFFIYCVSRGHRQMIIEYLSHYNIYKYFSDCLGSDSNHPINPYKNPELSNGQWALWKVSLLEQIIENNHADKSRIYFVDDTRQNILEAQKYGFVNSVCCPPKFSNSINCLKNILNQTN